MRRSSANLVLLLAGAFWGMGFIAQSTAMKSIGPLLFLALRFSIATVVVAPLAWQETRKERTVLRRRDVVAFAMCGAALFAAMATQQYGLLTTSVTNSGFLTGLYVVFTPILAVVWLRRPPHAIIWPAALLALTGVWMLSGGTFAALHIGDGLTILSAFLCALQITLVSRFLPGSGRPLTLSAMQYLVCSVLAATGALVFEPIVWQAIRQALPEIVYAGLIATAVAFTLQVVGQRYTSAPEAAVFLSSEALFAALFAVVFLGEPLGLLRLAGCLFIFAAILSVELVPLSSRRRRANAASKHPSSSDEVQSHF